MDLKNVDPLERALRLAREDCPAPPARMKRRLLGIPSGGSPVPGTRRLAWAGLGLAAAGAAAWLLLLPGDGRRGAGTAEAAVPVDSLLVALDEGRTPDLRSVWGLCDSAALPARAADPLEPLCRAKNCCVRSRSRVSCPAARFVHYDYGCAAAGPLVVVVLPWDVAVTYGRARTRSASHRSEDVCVAVLGGASAVAVLRGQDRWIVAARSDADTLLEMISGALERGRPATPPREPDPCAGPKEVRA